VHPPGPGLAGACLPRCERVVITFAVLKRHGGRLKERLGRTLA